MAIPVIMPKQGQSVESCIIVGWKKRNGDPVKTGEIICEVETDKATFEVESPADGTVLAIFFETGADVPVLTPIAAIGKPGENVDALRTARPGTTKPVAETRAVTTGKVVASPRARALAAARGVLLAGLHGTGPGGRIIERDVQGAAKAPPAPAPIAPGEYEETRVAGIRKLIAERMFASLQTTAQLTMHSSADARELQSLRRKFKESPASMGLNDVTINDMMLFAVARSLIAHPDMNAHFDGDVLRRYQGVHLGFAVDTPKGLMVPVVRNAHALGLRQIAAEAARLIKGCRDGGITLDELGGGTFTVTNLGVYGVQGFTPVLNVPQVGILGVGAIAPGPAVGADGAVDFIPQIALSLTINHQVVDGAPGARFLQTVAGAIAHFELLLAG